ncbi:unnamed protein product [Owenia fusiformis]|uniref:Thymidine phosphorylase n=1 Tax=Owenia fusiformis TaxID=6347 RepID=A0A8J1TCS9_OWEFU|nr:unnamed protein product [Owenia fusiformis]
MSRFAPSDLIVNVRDSVPLTQGEVEGFVDAVTNNGIQQAQIGAMLMAIRLNGLSADETIHLTRAMMQSGEVLQWPEEWTRQKRVVDKHSTGGVGDKVSVVLAPALAACGMKVPMISGRGLGFAHGTLDKLEAIPGFQISCSTVKMREILDEVGCCIVGQTETLVPADRILYAIRDVTGTVESVPLISSSIVSKKVAETLSALVLDVKCGKAAYMKTEKQARDLAESMVSSSCGVGVETVAILTRMDNPIGNYVGHSLEIIDAIETMQGNGPSDLVELVCTLGGHLLKNAGKVSTPMKGYQLIEETIANGSALEKFRLMMQAQEVDETTANSLCKKDVDFFSIFRPSKLKTDVKADSEGYISSVDAFALANVINSLGAGRAKAGDQINHSVGLHLRKHIGERVEKGEVWLTVHHESPLSGDHLKTIRNTLELQDKELPAGCASRIIDIITNETIQGKRDTPRANDMQNGSCD